MANGSWRILTQEIDLSLSADASKVPLLHLIRHFLTGNRRVQKPKSIMNGQECFYPSIEKFDKYVIWWFTYITKSSCFKN